MNELFPIFLKLRGRRCLIVGGGPVAESKMDSLLRCGGEVCVVAPEITSGIRQAAQEGKIVWERRPFFPRDLEGIFLVVAATSSPELHEEIFRQAQNEGVLCNAVDEPQRCDFYYPAVVRRGPLQIAVSTTGRSPFLAQRLRQQLEQQFGPEYEPWTEELGRQREELFRRNISPDQRRALLHELCSEEALEEFRRQRAPAEARAENGKVYFLGAGPGDPELLTLRARKILSSAQVVLHDALVPPEILQLAPAGALIRNVGKRCGPKSITQEEIHQLLVRYASERKIVIRLQGGDPLIFGRAGEEISALQEAAIDFEIVPGVTGASAAAAAGHIPLTDRRVASKVVFLSAHGREGEFERELRSLAAADSTLAIYMPGSDYARVWEALRHAGWEGDTPCLIVSQASTPQQIVYRTEVSSLMSLPALPAPALLIVGEVAAARKPEAALANVVLA
jgi:uroporphyrin-III C-methyltransferase / precorrin-2 dehydrogenase / sirohydrochlorin ferrochelatase